MNLASDRADPQPPAVLGFAALLISLYFVHQWKKGERGE